uniref:Transmembrane protein n=1 Tax=Heterorhabditis bacteriophora TaxID=37862 RepID=A0A1I7WUM3_HETBA
MGKTLIEVRGKCFNATLTVQKHTERCPWCPDPAEVTLIGQEFSEDPTALSASILSQLQGEDRFLHIGVLLLALIAIVASAAFGCVLVAYLRQKRLVPCTSYWFFYIVIHYPSYLFGGQRTVASCSLLFFLRYDMPWEQTRPLTYWLSNKSEATTTSPLDSASSIGAPYSYRSTSGGTIITPQTRLYHHISPNSSIGRHDDSGLESV